MTCLCLVNDATVGMGGTLRASATAHPYNFHDREIKIPSPFSEK